MEHYIADYYCPRTARCLGLSPRALSASEIQACCADNNCSARLLDPRTQQAAGMATGMYYIIYDNAEPPADYIAPGEKPRGCTCGAEKTYGKNCRVHTDWCDIASECKAPEITTGYYWEDSDT